MKHKLPKYETAGMLIKCQHACFSRAMLNFTQARNVPAPRNNLLCLFDLRPIQKPNTMETAINSQL
jgi:hypothetical protein